MLSERSIPGPKFNDPLVECRVLVEMFIAGKLYNVGDRVRIPTSDMQFAKNCCVPPRVELL
jgi:hypothetical protein